MSHDGLDYMAFTEASSISSRMFLTQTYTQYSSDGADRFYTPNQSCRIEVSGQSQNSFILPRTMRLVYHAVSTVQTLKDGSPGLPYALVNVADMSGEQSLRQLPGVAFYGAPHLGSVLCEVPGLASNLGYLSSDGQSQRFYTQRHLCSGDEGDCSVSGCKSTFRQKGRMAAAGGRETLQSPPSPVAVITTILAVSIIAVGVI